MKKIGITRFSSRFTRRWRLVGILHDRQDRVTAWLNRNGFCNLTVCPECRVDDFVHVEDCVIGLALEKMGNYILEYLGAEKVGRLR